MALDANAMGEGADWTCRYAAGKPEETLSLAEYFAALTNGNYLTEEDLRKLLSTSRNRPFEGPLTADAIPFRFFRVNRSSLSNQPFIVSSNWENGRIVDRPPFGKKRFVVFRRDGSGGIFMRQSDASSTNIFPSKGPNGEPISYETLK